MSRDTVDAVLAWFVAPARVASLVAEIERGPGELPAAIALLRERLEVSDAALVVALDAAGVPVSEAARLVGVSVTDANVWLDDDQSIMPERPWRPTLPSGLVLARRAVRLVWVLLAIGALAAVVQSRGGIRPCPDQVCIDWVDVELDDGTSVEATERSVFSPTEVESVRFRHRTATSVDGTVTWMADGEQVFATRVTLRGNDVLVVDWPGQRLPTGVHVVELVGGPTGSSITFAVARPGD